MFSCAATGHAKSMRKRGGGEADPGIMVSRAIVQFIALFPRLARSGSSTGRQIGQTIPQFSINYFHYGILWYIFGIFGIFANSFVSLFSIDVKLTVDFNFELFAIAHTHTYATPTPPSPPLSTAARKFCHPSFDWNFHSLFARSLWPFVWIEAMTTAPSPVHH